MPGQTDAAAIVSMVLSALLGAGGVGFTLVQWWTKRRDPEWNLKTIRVMTDVTDARMLEMMRELREQREMIDQLRMLLKDARSAARTLLRVLLAQTECISDKPDIQAAIKDMERHV